MSEQDRQHLPNLPAPARAAVAAYRAQFAQSTDSDNARPLVVAWASGRVNLIGEHTDYNEGFVLPVAISRVVALAGRVAPGSASITTCYSRHHDQHATFQMDRAALAEQPPKQKLPLWARYVRGVLAELAEASADTATPAFTAAIAGDVPVGGGMSSSAALEVATATFAAALGGPSFDPMTTARLCQRAEQRSAGANVGIMDQATSCLGRAGEAIFLDCRSLSYEYVPVNLPGVVLAVFDTGVSHSNANSGYNERRRQCEEATKLLAAAIQRDEPQRNISALRDITADDLVRYGAALTRRDNEGGSDDVLLRRARHVVSENERVQRAVEALRAGDAEALGALLYASHASLRDDYEVSCAELDAVVEIARSVPGVYGARMMGAGFGGSALILVRDEAQPALAAALSEQYPPRANRQGTLHICEVSGGPAYSTVSLDNL